MTATAALKPQGTTYPEANSTIPPSVEAILTILDYYGFDHFFENTLRKLNLNDPDYGDAVDEALSRHRDDDLNHFSLRRIFENLVEELKEENDYTTEEALTALADEDFTVDVDTAMLYSVDAGETDVEHLSLLIRTRAKRLLRQLQRKSRRPN